MRPVGEGLGAGGRGVRGYGVMGVGKEAKGSRMLGGGNRSAVILSI